ncbi:hypothetical protein BKA62DRAFT_682078, partial [Auriculariales sp. MPI-PUGE-AT-0066]
MELVHQSPSQGQPPQVMQHSQAQQAVQAANGSGLQIPPATLGRACERCRKTGRTCEPREGALACAGCNQSRVACSLVGEIQGTAGTRRASPTKRNTANLTPTGANSSGTATTSANGVLATANSIRKRARSSTAPEVAWDSGGPNSGELHEQSPSQQPTQMNHPPHQLPHSPALQSNGTYAADPQTAAGFAQLPNGYPPPSQQPPQQQQQQQQQPNPHIFAPNPKRRKTGAEEGNYTSGPIHADPLELDAEVDEIREVIMDINSMHSEISRKLARLNKLWTRKYGDKL